jgi:hypothetical protein
VDARGNIYLAEPVKPPGRSYPEFFDGKLAAPPASSDAVGDRYWTSHMYGSIIKFSPSGGAIWYDKGQTSSYVIGQPPAALLAKPTIKVQAHLGFKTQQPAEIQGAQWYRFGFSPHSLRFTGTATCMCEGAGFDVDPYGRVFYPNAGQFRVEVVDANNNRIAAFGKYGNQDSGGAKAPVKKPEIPFAWPLTVVVSDTHAYVADTINRRVVKVRLAHQLESERPIP